MPTIDLIGLPANPDSWDSIDYRIARTRLISFMLRPNTAEAAAKSRDRIRYALSSEMLDQLNERQEADETHSALINEKKWLDDHRHLNNSKRRPSTYRRQLYVSPKNWKVVPGRRLLTTGLIAKTMVDMRTHVKIPKMMGAIRLFEGSNAPDIVSGRRKIFFLTAAEMKKSWRMYKNVAPLAAAFLDLLKEDREVDHGTLTSMRRKMTFFLKTTMNYEQELLAISQLSKQSPIAPHQMWILPPILEKKPG